MYHCFNCNEDFYEPGKVHTTYERFYGGCEDWGSVTPMTIDVCPYCGSDEFEEEDDDKEEE